MLLFYVGCIFLIIFLKHPLLVQLEVCNQTVFLTISVFKSITSECLVWLPIFGFLKCSSLKTLCFQRIQRANNQKISQFLMARFWPNLMVRFGPNFGPSCAYAQVGQKLAKINCFIQKLPQNPPTPVIWRKLEALFKRRART